MNNTRIQHNLDARFVFTYMGREEVLRIGRDRGIYLEDEDWELQPYETAWPPFEEWARGCMITISYYP